MADSEPAGTRGPGAPASALLLGEGARPRLARVNRKVDRASAYLAPLMPGLVGGALVADAIRCSGIGEGLV